MEHVEDVLFNAERSLMRRYPSKAKLIAAQTKALWHHNGVSVRYCAICMAQALKLEEELIAPFYYTAKRDAEAAEQAQKQAASARLRRAVFAVWGAVVVAGAVLVVLYAS